MAPKSTQAGAAHAVAIVGPMAIARLLAMHERPYLSAALCALTPVESTHLPTMAVDNYGRLYWNPEKVAQWGPKATAGVLLHEVWHILRDHAARAKAQGVGWANHAAWNQCADAEENDDIRDDLKTSSKIALPIATVGPDAGKRCEGVFPADLGQAEYLTAEEYYNALPEGGEGPGGDAPRGGKKPNKSMGEHEGNCCGGGSGSDGLKKDWELGTTGKDAETAPPLSDLEKRAIAKTVAEAIRSCGTVPAGYKRWAEETLAPAKVPWQKVLASVLRGALSRAGSQDYSYARLSRRRVPGIIMPAMIKRIPEVTIVVDTSGSISDRDLTRARSEIEGVCKAQGTAATIMAVDAAVHSTKRVSRGAGIALEGGGGTNMGVGIAAAAAKKGACDVIIVLTDGCTPWPESPPRGIKVIVVLAGQGHASKESVPTWAQTLEIDD